MHQRIRQIASHESARFIGLGALAGLILLAVALVWRGARDETIVLEVQSVGDPNAIRVFVGGAVQSPGLYTLERGQRVADAIEAAGGILPNADISGMGMAAPLRDADQIFVASNLPSPPAGGSTPLQTSTSLETPTTININRASAEQLEDLPGIGPAIAARIVDYRQRNGAFRSVDELEQIRGISGRMVEELRPLVTTGP